MFVYSIFADGVHLSSFVTASDSTSLTLSKTVSAYHKDFYHYHGVIPFGISVLSAEPALCKVAVDSGLQLLTEQ